MSVQLDERSEEGKENRRKITCQISILMHGKKIAIYAGEERLLIRLLGVAVERTRIRAHKAAAAAVDLRSAARSMTMLCRQ